MSSRHHIDDFMRGQDYWKDRRRAYKITDVAREFDIAHSDGMCSRRHGGGRVTNTTSAEDRYIVYQQKGTGAPQLSGWQISFLLPQESRSPEKLFA
ncbi:hypothetical protein TNCV_4224131 [Trichonephila clavipes]|nr:hypothetical protein TNCV_4224131 [Trichonephila clavipes]